jgi:hypothetical protein
MKVRDVDPKIRRYFPWSLFLAAAAMLLLASCYSAHAEEDVWACYGSARYQAMSAAWTPCNEMSKICIRVRAYLAEGHTPDEGRALAKSMKVPQWIVNRAERCLP